MLRVAADGSRVWTDGRVAEREFLGEFVRYSVKAGATDLVVSGPASGIDWRGEGYESVRLFAERVLPELARW